MAKGEGGSVTKHERVAREIVTLCVGNPDEPETDEVMAILLREYGWAP